MDFSEIMNIILSGGLVGTAAAIGSLRATVRKAKAEAMKAEADAEGVRVDNAEHATRLLRVSSTAAILIRSGLIFGPHNPVGQHIAGSKISILFIFCFYLIYK